VERVYVRMRDGKEHREWKRRLCAGCLIQKSMRLFREDATSRCGLAATCAACQDGEPVPPGLEARRAIWEERRRQSRRQQVRREAADREQRQAESDRRTLWPRPSAAIGTATAREQVAYCASLYEDALARVRTGELPRDSAEFLDARKSMEFLAREAGGMVRVGDTVYRWDRQAERLDRRSHVTAGMACHGEPAAADTRVFREPRLQPERGIPMRPVYA